VGNIAPSCDISGINAVRVHLQKAADDGQPRWLAQGGQTRNDAFINLSRHFETLGHIHF
jgi:hypothetical protein